MRKIKIKSVFPGELFILALHLGAQSVDLRPVPPAILPPVIDGNSAAVWHQDELLLFHSDGRPTLSRGPNQFALGPAEPIRFDSQHLPAWFEAAWRDEDGTIFLWYHHEPSQACPNGLTAPKIGAAMSRDGGRTVEDLGIILESGERLDCSAENGFFAGGHGDFSVVLDRDKRYFYFFFSTYGGPFWQQGVAVARMAFEDRFAPVGRVWKYYDFKWAEPGLGGLVTPVWRVDRAWQLPDAEAFWGPSVHWNTFLERYVVLLNRACCEPGWRQEGIYIAFIKDLEQPWMYGRPGRILERSELPRMPGFYPQVLGLENGETDHLAGQVARLYVQGVSRWEIIFHHQEEEPPPEPCEEYSSVCLPPTTTTDR